MQPNDLSMIADALLSLCEGDDERPFYSEETLRYKLRQASRRDATYGFVTRSKPADALFRHEYEELIDKANLTPRQDTVLRQRMDGWTFEEIGREAGHSKQGAQHTFLQAMKKLAKAMRVYPWRGLSEVYRQETRRGQRKSGFGRMQGT